MGRATVGSCLTIERWIATGLELTPTGGKEPDTRCKSQVADVAQQKRGSATNGQRTRAHSQPASRGLEGRHSEDAITSRLPKQLNCNSPHHVQCNTICKRAESSIWNMAAEPGVCTLCMPD
jgi:hypothetical protein